MSEPDGGDTIGVAEEFLLVDLMTGFPQPRADAVLARVRRADPDIGARCKPELSATQVEAVTEVRSTLDEVADDLTRGRRVLATHAAAERLALVSTGLPVLSTGAEPLSTGERFECIGRRYRAVVAGNQCCACHVHIGVSDQDTAVRAVNRVRPWLPTLLALSVNSPWSRGQDTGYQSWRVMEQARFPGSGIPPAFASVADYDTQVGQLVDAGVLIDERMTFWFVRPSHHLPTVEFRVADAATTVDEAVLQAALSRALVRTAIADLRAGRPEPTPPDHLLGAAVWAAARYGMAGTGFDPWTGRRLPTRQLAHRLLGHLRPALAASGDLPAAQYLLHRLLDHGTGAARQRAAAVRGLPALLPMIADETLTGFSRVPGKLGRGRRVASPAPRPHEGSLRDGVPQ